MRQRGHVFRGGAESGIADDLRSPDVVALIWIEIWGNLAGPWALLRSHWRVRRQGRSEPYIPPTQRPNVAEPALLERSVGQERQPERQGQA